MSSGLQMVHRPGTKKNSDISGKKGHFEAKHFSFPKNFHRIQVTPLGPGWGLHFQVLVTASPTSPYSYLSLSRGEASPGRGDKNQLLPSEPQTERETAPSQVHCSWQGRGGKKGKKGGRNHRAGWNPMWREREECRAAGRVGE